MELDKKINDLIQEGKSDEEIATTLLSEKDVKDSYSAQEVAEKIYDLKKSDEAIKYLAEKKKQDQEKLEAKKIETDQEKKIANLVNEKLKTISIDSFGDLQQPKVYKQFNMSTGKVEEVGKLSDAKAKFNEMVRCIGSKRLDRAASISQEIYEDNVKVQALLEGKQTPTVSDVDARGGFAVPTEVNEEIMQRIYAQSKILEAANTDVIIVNDKIYPTMGNITVDWIADQSTTVAESNPVFSNPTITMERAGAFSQISNTILAQKGADITGAFTTGYSSAFARFLDFQTIVGSTVSSDLMNGLIFDSNAVDEASPVVLANLAISDLMDMCSNIDDESRDDLRWISNKKVETAVGLLENSNGNNLFPQFISGGDIRPRGIDYIQNNKIPSDLEIGTNANTGGTDDVLVLVDMSQFIIGIDSETRIDTSSDFAFTDDVLTMRGIKRCGFKLIFNNAARVLELSN